MNEKKTPKTFPPSSHNSCFPVRTERTLVRSGGLILDSSKKGFSLVETIIYIGLLVLVLVAIMNMTLSMARAYGYFKLSRHVQTSAINALDRMVRDIRNAQSVNVGQSTLGTSPGVLTLITTSATGTAQTLQFYVATSTLRVKQDGGDVGPLTLSDVSVSSLIFRQISTGISQAVKIELTLSTGSGSTTRTANFYDTAILRDSY